MRQLPSRGNSGFMDDKDVALEVTVQDVAEKSLTTSQVNDIVKREKARAAERTRQEMSQAHQEELERMRLEKASTPQGSIDTSAIEERVYNKFMGDLKQHHEENERIARETELKQVADQYYLKMGKGSQLFEDFNEVMGDFEPAAFPNAVMLAAGMENTSDIMYELTKNPTKLQQIDS